MGPVAFGSLIAGRLMKRFWSLFVPCRYGWHCRLKINTMIYTMIALRLFFFWCDRWKSSASVPVTLDYPKPIWWKCQRDNRVFNEKIWVIDKKIRSGERHWCCSVIWSVQRRILKVISVIAICTLTSADGLQLSSSACLPLLIFIGFKFVICLTHALISPRQTHQQAKSSA